MINKWHKFHSMYSPVVAGTVNRGSNGINFDWIRLANEDATINGIKIETYKANYNEFETPDNLKKFFAEIILKELNPNIDKDRVIEYLLTSFHQGGLMYPVSASLANFLHDKAKLQQLPTGAKRQIRIDATEKGFKVQEVYSAYKFHQLKELAEDLDEVLIEPDEGQEFIIKVGASIDVDFSQVTAETNELNDVNKIKEPIISVKVNYISYGSEEVKRLLDNRDWKQIIVDFFRNLFNLNSLPDINADEEEPEENSRACCCC